MKKTVYFNIFASIFLCAFLLLETDVVKAQATVKVHPNFSTIDPTAVCGFYNRTLELYVVGANDTCSWTVPDGMCLSSTARGRRNGAFYGDTITLYFKEEPVTGIVAVAIGKPTVSSGDIMLTQIPKPKAVGAISVDMPICEGIETSFKIAVDNANYSPGTLCIRWTVHDKNEAVFSREEKCNIADRHNFNFVSNSIFADGSVRATPYTCDGNNVVSASGSITLTPFIKKDWFTKTPHPINQIFWQTIDNPEWRTASTVSTVCSYYNPTFNKTDNSTLSFFNNFFGAGDGYVYLQVDDYKNLMSIEDPEKFPEYYYSYEWSFDPTHYAIDEDKMDESMFKAHGFGRNKNRIALKVLNPGAPNISYPVSVTIKCEECISKGGSTSDFSTTATRNFTRLDSIKNFKEYTVKSENSTVCAGVQNRFELEILDQDLYNSSNAKIFNWNVPSSWEHIGGDGSTQTYKTGWNSVSETIGDTARIKVYPHNACFRNGRDTSRNGKEIKIFVKNPPLRPRIIDPHTKYEYAPEYTEFRLDERPVLTRIDTIPMLMCNYNSWIGDQRFGIKVKSDSIRSFHTVDFDNLLTPGDDVFMADKLTKDSGMVSINISAISRDRIQGFQSRKVGFYATNACGKGDTGVFYVNVIDTLSVYSPIATPTSIDDWFIVDTLCEGTVLNLTSKSIKYTAPFVEDRFAVTDKVQYDWSVPSGWKINGSNPNPSTASIYVGKEHGPVKLNFTNKCGSGSAVETLPIFVRNFVRVNIGSDQRPCRNDIISYTFDTAFEASGYQWTFPNDWVIEGTEPPTNTAISTNLEADENGKISLDVRIGVDSGYVYVVGSKNTSSSCDFRFENYLEKHRRDSLKVKPKNFTSSPVKDGSWPDTICASDLVSLKVKPNENDENVYFTWEFPDTEWENGITYSSVKDTANFNVPVLSHTTTELRVVSHRSDCDATNVGDTLIYSVLVMDTLTTVGPFYDAKYPDMLLNHNPCEGDTVFYTLESFSQDPSAYYWTFNWNDSRDFVKGDSITLDGWRVLNTAPYNDTLKMIVGRSALTLGAANVALCDTSAYYKDVIEPISTIREKASFVDANEFLCDKEEIEFVWNSVEHATHYILNYPWGDGRDTIEDGGTDLYSSVFQNVAYAKGKAFVQTYNSCGFGPAPDTLEIKDILYPPLAPDVYYINGAFSKGSADTAMDTICLRNEVELKALYKDVENPNYEWVYSWELTENDASVSLTPSAAPNDSICKFIKNSGGNKINFISVAARHKSCTALGNSQIIELRAMDTAAISSNKNIRDYLFDDLTGTKIETGPCGSVTTSYYFDNYNVDPTISKYYFIWNDAQNYNPADSTMDGTSFKLLEIPNDLTTMDTLKMAVGSGEVLNVQVVTQNYCGLSKLPLVKIETKEAIIPTDIYSVHQLSTALCNNEEITFKLDTLPKATSYIWHFPWEPYIDTVVTATRVFNADYKPGKIFVHPNNGCGEGHASDTIELEINDILLPPSKVVPIDFAAAYDPAVDVKAVDTICVRTDNVFSVACPGFSKPDINYKWELISGKIDGITTAAETDSIISINQDSLYQNQYSFYVAAKLDVCESYGDSLKVELFAMDTLSFVSDPVADPDAAPFSVQTIALVYDNYPTPSVSPISLTPCGLETVMYKIIDNVHWSLDTNVWFSWNGGHTSVGLDSTLHDSDWKCRDPELLPEVLWAKVGNTTPLSLSLNTRNRCGLSHSAPIEIVSNSMVVDKPTLKSITNIICYDESFTLSVNEVPFAEKYVWRASWKTGTDTTALPKKTYDNYRETNGYIRVWAINECGVGPISDSIKIENMRAVPQRPDPTWFANLDMIGDTVYDTICLNGGDFLLKAVSFANGQADEGVVYDWKLVNGNMEFIPDAKTNDTICTITPSSSAAKEEKALFMVASKKESCRLYSDTLYIELSITDTVPVADIGALMLSSEFNPQPCPGSTITLSVEKPDKAPAFHWTLPSDWSFADGVDSASGEVVVVVGSVAGVISVAPATDRIPRQCSYYAIDNALKTDLMTPHQPLQTEDFSSDFESSPCVGSEYTYKVNTTADALAYRWELPFGWKVIKDIPDAEADSVSFYGTAECKVVVGKTPGKIRVYALDSCDDYLVRGFVKEKEVNPVDTAKIVLLSDASVCIDSVLSIEVQHNTWSNGKYNLDVRYKGPDLTVNTIDFPLSPDSSMVDIKCSNRDSVFLTFTPINAVCSQNVMPAIKVIVADTVPSIPGEITGPDRSCMGSILEFKAMADMDNGSNVKYHWEVPEEGGWRIESGADSSIALIRVGFYTTPNAQDTIKCYPKALCGTAEPYLWVINIEPPIPFEDTIVPDVAYPCVGSDVNFSLKGEYDTDTISFQWTAPQSWVAIGNTNLNQVSYTVSLAENMNVEVRFFKNGACGLSEPVIFNMAVKDSAYKAKIKDLPFPCQDNESIEFKVVPDIMIDSIQWLFPVLYQPDISVITTAGSAIKNDSVVLVNSGISSAFDLNIRSFNNCGHRDTIITITPVDRISDFASELKTNHYCVGDTAFAYIPIPSSHKNKGTVYTWSIVGSSLSLKDTIEENGDMAVLSFINDGTLDSISLNIVAQNSCNKTDVVSIKSAPHTYYIKAKPGVDTAIYMQTGIALGIDDVEYGVISDYDYTWSPGNRISVSGFGTADVVYQTKEVVMPVETYYVVSNEKQNNDPTLPDFYSSSSCLAYDTVLIFVDSTFALAPKLFDTACMDLDIEIDANPYGGNLNKYFLSWYRANEDMVYEPLNESGNALTLMADAPIIDIMVVGYDSTYLYPAGSVDAEPLFAYSKRDTQYIQITTFDIEARWVQPGKEQVKVPYGTKITLSALVSGGNGYYYKWEPKEFMEPHDSTSSTVRTLRLYSDIEPQLTITDSLSGCTKTLSVSVLMADEIGDVPNAFSPNGDGINDVFMRGVDLLIFDRMGVELFRSTSKEGWDGTYKGVLVKKADYLYVVSVVKDGQTYTKKGVVTVF